MYIQITDMCNMTCKHCGFACTKKGSMMTRETFIKSCEIAHYEDDPITIGGGEPTLHPLLFDFIGIALSYASDGLECGVYMVTNGKLTSPALKLAKMASNGVLGVALSQDEYHSKIDPRVVRAFTKPERQYGQRENDCDHRALNTLHNLSPFGRAKRLIDKGENVKYHVREGCFCDGLFVAPSGVLWACGCRTVSFGTVDNPQIPGAYLEYDEKCYRNFKYKNGVLLDPNMDHDWEAA